LRLVDAHVHLPSYGDPRPVLAGAAASGTFLLSCTVNPSEAMSNLELRKEYPEIVASFLGVHPSDVGPKLPSEELGALFAQADGIGEIGLDDKYSSVAPESPQRRAFVDQLSIAEKLGKPVQVHSRGSAELCLEIMSSFRLKQVLMHWFEDESLLPEVESRGYFVSVGPAILYSKKLRRIYSTVATESLLTESDGPVEFGVLGGGSGPGLVPSVDFALSELRRRSFEEIADAVSENAGRFLGRRLGAGKVKVTEQDGIGTGSLI
jgi:TatD DNase family protein